MSCPKNKRKNLVLTTKLIGRILKYDELMTNIIVADRKRQERETAEWLETVAARGYVHVA